jgi:hypothetical protein
MPLRSHGAQRALTGIAGNSEQTSRRGCDELEPRRKDRCACGPCNRDDSVLERLAQRFERRPLKLGQLVE